nr:T9SS type A sorting domain-containing protein [Bacteroidota bacterium]
MKKNLFFIICICFTNSLFAQFDTTTAIYDFNALTNGNLGGQDNWVTTKWSTNIDIQVADTGYDATKALYFNQVGPGVGCDASKELDSISFPGITFSTESTYILSFDIKRNYWALSFGFAADLNNDGKVTKNDANEKALILTCSNQPGLGEILLLPNGTTMTYNAGINAWTTYEITLSQMNTVAGGLVGVRLKQLGTSAWTVVASNLNAGIDTTVASNQNPFLWNMLFMHYEGSLGKLDNIRITKITPSASVVALQSSDTIFCEKQCIDFTDLSTNNPTSWQWYFNGASPDTSTVQNPTNICYNNYGSFDVTLIACNTAGCDTLTLPGFINEYQSPIPTITQSNDTLFASAAVSFQWWSVSAGIIPGATNSFFIPTQAGNYYVIINDSIGCAGTSNVIAITGVKENGLSSSIKIYPKPSNGKFNIELLNIPTEKPTLTLRNVIGQKLQELKLINKTTEVNFDAEDGVYFLTITTDTKGSYTEKIILQRVK